ncbi:MULTISPECIES: aldose epimerase family protein [Caproicibacterium]|uniref:Aldose 1-epimerase n=1 Tax=Caproicibacterium argilliputei TaxID=3030016 RepID=A0AA97DC15_9FIRM|nr:aldose epimerase family protein [Caproicibacterium argilliputei]WOC32992.1 aldose epimerase family protein [Caproicibacterium argilliputei]
MSISEKKFGVLQDGTEIRSYTLQNESGASLTVLSFGARIQSVQMPDKNGVLGEMVLGHRTLEEYAQPGDYQGAVVGRYANRIAGGAFELDGQPCTLTKNEGENTLHGGPTGFSTRAWRCKSRDNSDEAPSITLEYQSADGEEGFPGACTVTVTYCLSTDNAVILDYTAVTDRATYVNLTNHSFFNLTGDCSRDVLSTELQIDADATTEVDKALLPTGKLLSVAGTAEDFRSAKTIGQDIRSLEPTLHDCGGYDHNFVLNGDGFRKAAEAHDASTGRRLLVFTDQPGMQLYTANSFGASAKNRDGSAMKPHTAFCLETQHFADTPHHANFPSTLLQPGDTFRTRTIFKFEADRK